MDGYQVRRLSAEQWRRFRDIRLEALKDTPIGFGERYQEAAARTDEEWCERARNVAEPASTALFAALDDEGRFVGIIGVYPRPATAEGREHVVYSVYVTPAHRGAQRGVATKLFDAAIAWAREIGKADIVTLSVHERNDRAHAFYRRYGFVDTGETIPYVLDESASLIVMRYEG